MELADFIALEDLSVATQMVACSDREQSEDQVLAWEIKY